MQQVGSATAAITPRYSAVPLSVRALDLQQLDLTVQQYARFMQHTGSATSSAFDATAPKTSLVGNSLWQQLDFTVQQ
jgi:hypothetical protein